MCVRMMILVAIYSSFRFDPMVLSIVGVYVRFRPGGRLGIVQRV